ncbi:MAG: GAF domain-containing protein [bacterium]|nr:GAF domain-containing protein [bacterium]
MRDINELIAKLRIETGKPDRGHAFRTVIQEIETYYTENFFLNPYEVGIFLVNDEKTVLSFACPEYLVNSGMIPVSSTEAFTASIFRTGRGIVENALQQQKHLAIFEVIRTPEGKIMPIYKMMGALIAIEEDKIGVIEISRRSSNPADQGEDFGEQDLEFLEKSIKILAPFLKKVLPDNFRGKITG